MFSFLFDLHKIDDMNLAFGWVIHFLQLNGIQYMPLIFGFIYLNVAAILNVYFIVSSAIRIGTQEVLFRKGIVAGPNSPAPTGSGKSRAISSPKENGVDTIEKPLPKPKATGTGAKGPSGSNGSKASTNGKSSNGSNGKNSSSDNGSEPGTPAKKQHPRAKDKKERKAR